MDEEDEQPVAYSAVEMLAMCFGMGLLFAGIGFGIAQVIKAF